MGGFVPERSVWESWQSGNNNRAKTKRWGGEVGGGMAWGGGGVGRWGCGGVGWGRNAAKPYMGLII